MSDVRETIARALCRLDGYNPGEPGSGYDGHALVARYLTKADAMLADLSSAGMKVVADEPRFQAGTGPGTNTGHGHVWRRPDGALARCGGPALCVQCAYDQARVGAAK